MTLSVDVVGMDEVKKLINLLPEHTFNEAKKELNKASFRAQKTIIGNFTSFSGGFSRKLRSRSGQLKRSIKVESSGDKLDNVTSKLFTDIKYAPIHEEGGTITAKNKYVRVPGGPYLNIPLSNNLTASGVLRQNARQVFAQGGYIIKSRKGNWIVMSGANLPMFVLKSKVTIIPRLGMVDAASDEVPTILFNLRQILLKGL